jgi:hypothetical protein
MTPPDQPPDGSPGQYLIALHVDRLLLSSPMNSLAALRLVAAAHAIAICVQPVLAGIYLNGSGAAIRLHEPIGLGLTIAGLVQLLIAMIYWRGGGRLLAPVVTLLITLGEGLQVGMGYGRQLALHIPLGIALVAGAVCFAFWTSSPSARIRRTTTAEEVTV